MENYEISEIESSEHDNTYGVWASLVQIDSTHYILAYAGAGGDGFIKTFSIDGSYENITEIDSLEHDSSEGQNNSLVQIDDTHFILAYSGDGHDGYIKTFSIDESYEISQIDVMEHDEANGLFNSLIKIDNTHFMLAYAGADYDGFIKTFSIDESYKISQIDVMEHDTNNGKYNSLLQIDSTHYILAYSNMNLYGVIKTFSINESYEISQTDSLIHDNTHGVWASLVKIDSTHYILAYKSYAEDWKGVIKTFYIDESYEISQIDSLTHDTGNMLDNSLTQIDSTHYILAYSGVGYDGFIKTFSIDGSYENITEIDSLEHDTNTGKYNSLLQIDSTHYILAYAGAGDDGFIKTFYVQIEITVTGKSQGHIF
jgi:hypothetical protein